MDNEYVKEGYNRMMNYMREKRILTRERNFRGRLERFYNKYKDKSFLDVNEELEYLKLERYFYNEILTPNTAEEQALVNFLNVVTSVDKIENIDDSNEIE